MSLELPIRSGYVYQQIDGTLQHIVQQVEVGGITYMKSTAGKLFIKSNGRRMFGEDSPDDLFEGPIYQRYAPPRQADILIGIANGEHIQRALDRNCEKWVDVSMNEALKYIAEGTFVLRIKPKTFTREIPVIHDAIFGPPLEVSTIFVADPTSPSFCSMLTWRKSSMELQLLLNRRLLHWDKEDAIEHAKALIEIYGGKI